MNDKAWQKTLHEIARLDALLDRLLTLQLIRIIEKRIEKNGHTE